MTHTTTRDALLTRYQEVRARLGDRRTPVRPIIPRDRIRPVELASPVTLDQPNQPNQNAPIALPKEGPPKVAEGIKITKIPPRQSTRIIEEVAARHGMSVEEMKSKSRKDRIVAARHEAFFLLREAGYSFPQIGRFFGGMDHTTALHGAVKYEAKLKAEREAKHD